MAYIIVSGEILPGQLYYVPDASVVYNAVTYIAGQSFRGVASVKTFTYSSGLTQVLYEVLELLGGAIEYVENNADQPSYSDVTEITGFAIEFALNDAEKTVQETTKITGFAIELVDFPFYSFEITEIRL